jgi:hypothetical protein
LRVNLKASEKIHISGGRPFTGLLTKIDVASGFSRKNDASSNFRLNAEATRG